MFYGKKKEKDFLISFTKKRTKVLGELEVQCSVI